MIDSELKIICERIMRLEAEKKTISDDIAEVKKEAESKGFDKALVSMTAKFMAMEESKRRAQLDQLELFSSYLENVGLSVQSFEVAA